MKGRLLVIRLAIQISSLLDQQIENLKPAYDNKIIQSVKRKIKSSNGTINTLERQSE